MHPGRHLMLIQQSIIGVLSVAQIVPRLGHSIELIEPLLTPLPLIHLLIHFIKLIQLLGSPGQHLINRVVIRHRILHGLIIRRIRRQAILRRRLEYLLQPLAPVPLISLRVEQPRLDNLSIH